MKITEKAIAKLREVLPPGYHVRVSILGGGCSGYTYHLAEEPPAEKKSDDKELIFNDTYVPVVVVIDPRSSLFLDKVVLDYSDGLNGHGFEFSNPEAKRVCGCGTSFSV